MPECWVAERYGKAVGRCDGLLIRAHLLPKQRIRRELRLGRSEAELDALVWDERVWVPCCGGMTGIGGHHGMLDGFRVVVSFEALPVGVVEFAREHGLMWSLERDYPREVAA